MTGEGLHVTCDPQLFVVSAEVLIVFCGVKGYVQTGFKVRSFLGGKGAEVFALIAYVTQNVVSAGVNEQIRGALVPFVAFLVPRELDNLVDHPVESVLGEVASDSSEASEGLGPE